MRKVSITNNMKLRKLTTASMLVGISVVCSPFYIPIGVTKCFPIQHFINVLAAVILGPFYGVAMAFVTSMIRVMMATGSLLAFPGSMCGAFLCGILYHRTKNIGVTLLGEVIGTGIIGALLAYPVATLLLTKTVALWAFILPFGLSSLVGSALSVIFIVTMKKMNVFQQLKLEGVNDERR